MFALLSQVKFPANIKLIRFFLETKSSVNQGVDELQTKILSQCTVFRKAYILSGFGFHEFLYSIIESF